MPCLRFRLKKLLFDLALTTLRFSMSIKFPELFSDDFKSHYYLILLSSEFGSSGFFLY